MPNLVGDSNTQNVPAVFGNNTDGGTGVYGQSINGWGTSGRSETSTGVTGLSTSGIGVVGGSRSGTGVNGVSDAGVGVSAESSQNTALIATTRGRDVSALIVNQWGSGNIIIGRDNRNAEVFRVLNNGDVQVRGITLTSDKNAKENFSNVNTLEILDNLASMPILSWNYKEDPSSKRHIGPTAQDFHATFGLNGDDNNKHISSVDLQGVALAAIQGLNEKLKAENVELYAKLASLEERLSALESRG
ncbi:MULTISPECIES: tail fiber domain-containing protein [Bacillus cereus group]|uniref:tail fiber domain-containing protein n=1 Tax=Bacillus cereus group TaxID=86661 RepID=UPI002E1C12D3|nr:MULTISPECIES: tail fiber domain-containing protein [Bacillus cereus group]MED0990289.1 tail fiber domain-containing protein [Bacillus nitratireducens]MED1408068.1 tail fiber domain-containing protein [Bacillus paramycoides]MED1462564.1 tail fiber domain-containing protein [Bacillus paramycoides]MED1493993.1 tail fiber domain-containing protein [Bacillus paramycoides]